MAGTVQRLSVHAAGVALLVGGFVFGVLALTAALAQLVGVPLAFAIVALMLALAGGGMMLGVRQQPRPPKQASAPRSLESMLVELAVIAAKETIKGKSRSKN